MSGLKGRLNNHSHGLIATPGALLLNSLGKVDNSAGGEISSSHESRPASK
nr:hypothetical protein [uncultured Pseudomonas sp.]